MDKTKVELEVEVVNDLIKLKKVGDTYSSVIKRLLKDKGEDSGETSGL